MGTRKLFLTGVVALLVGALLWQAHSPRSTLPQWVKRITPETRSKRPNILLVVYDARRRDDFSFGPFGNRRGDTPFLTAFKDDAVYFESAISPGCWTVPVHASMFSGLSVCELGNDYYNRGWASFPHGFLSLAEILRYAGYQTIAYPDHPYFYNSNLDLSLMRGFEQFNVVTDYERYTSATNIHTNAGRVEYQSRLDEMGDLPPPELDHLVARFNQGGLRFDPGRVGDFDPLNRIYLAKLPALYRESSYFRKRYGEEFERDVFRGRRERPFFLFLNLHMATVARPEPGLFSRWFLTSLMLNAQERGQRLESLRPGETIGACLERNHRKLGLPHAPLPDPMTFMKQVFDNRFYDASFQAVWEYLEARGLSENTVVAVTSDHGMSFRENGESLFLHSGARPHQYMIQVPLVIRFPRGSELARWHGTRKEGVSLTDLFPTLVELGVGPGVFQRDLPIRGLSLLSRLGSRSFEPFLVAEASLGPTTYRQFPRSLGYAKAVLEDGMKLVLAPSLYRAAEGSAGWPITMRLDESWHPEAGPSRGLERLERPLRLLFDLTRDPHERQDIAPQQAALAERLERRLGSWACRAPAWGNEGAIWNGEALATLRTLGYVQ